MRRTTGTDQLNEIRSLLAQAEQKAEQLDGHPDILQVVTVAHLTVVDRISEVRSVQQTTQAA